jgi:hypothetical protein
VRIAILSTAVAICVASLVLRYFAPRYSELRVSYNSYDVCLYRSADQTRFGQVKRAFVRALEAERRRSRMMSDDRKWPVREGTYQRADSFESTLGV